MKLVEISHRTVKQIDHFVEDDLGNGEFNMVSSTILEPGTWLIGSEHWIYRSQTVWNMHEGLNEVSS